MNVKKLREWAGLNGVDFAAKIGISRSALSGIEKAVRAQDAPSARLISAMIDKFTPTVLFMNDCEQSKMVADSMLLAGQMDCIADAENIEQHLKGGLRIIVITDDKEPFLQQIAGAQAESGLPHIPVRGIKFADGKPSEWNC